MKEKILSYHPHIDGLRAIAVTLVVLFHLNPDWFPNGYLGVDVFFVISGFVISQSLYKEFLETKTISIKNFYMRRLRRLYPALVVMVAVTSLVYLLFGFLWNTIIFTKSAITSIFAVSNFYYLKQSTNYFHQELANPLLHTWSLGIEEQFYVVYPLLLFILLLLVRKFKVRIYYLGLFFLVLTVGLYYSFVINSDNLWGEFYWPIARFWELGVGCALFFFSYTYRSLIFPALIAAAGFIVLLIPQIFITAVPSVQQATLTATSAAALIIFAGLYARTIGTDLLSKRWVVYTGKISYSLYLWHMPTIYFFSLYTSGILFYLGSLAVTVLLAVLSYSFVEKPLRYKMWLNKVFIYTGASAIVVVVALVVIFGRQPITTALDNSLNAVTAFAGNINYIESRTQLGERIQPDFEGYMMRLREFTACAEDTTPSKATSSCSWLGKNTKAIYLTGDSHASHFRPMVDGMPDSYDLFYQYTARNTIVNWNWYGAPIDTQKTIDQKVAELQQLDRVYEDVYFLLSMYFRKDADQTDTLEQNLTALVEALDPYAQIVLIAPTPVWPNGPSVCVLLGRKCMLDTQTDMETVAPILAVFNKIATTHDRVFVYNAYNEICTSDECSIYERSTDHLWYLDEDHLSVEGSKKLAPNFSAWFQNTFQN